MTDSARADEGRADNCYVDNIVSPITLSTSGLIGSNPKKPLIQELSLLSSFSKVGSFGRSLLQTISFSGIFLKVSSFKRTFPEVISLVSVFGRVISYLKILFQTTSFLEVPSKVFSSLRILTQDLFLGSAFSKISNFRRIFIQSLLFSDICERLKAMIRIFSESFGLSSIFSNISSFSRSLTEDLSSFSMISKVIYFYRNLSQTLHLILTIQARMQHILDQTILFSSEIVFRNLKYLYHTLILSEFLTFKSLKYFIQDLTLAPLFAYLNFFIRSLQEEIRFSLDFQELSSFARETFESLHTQEVLSRIVKYLRIIPQSLSLSSLALKTYRKVAEQIISFSPQTAFQVFKSLSLPFVILEQRNLYLAKSFLEILSLSLTRICVVFYSRALKEAQRLFSELLLSSLFIRLYFESLLFLEINFRTISYFRILTETFSFSDFLSIFSFLYRILLEVLTTISSKSLLVSKRFLNILLLSELKFIKDKKILIGEFILSSKIATGVQRILTSIIILSPIAVIRFSKQLKEHLLLVELRIFNSFKNLLQALVLIPEISYLKFVERLIKEILIFKVTSERLTTFKKDLKEKLLLSGLSSILRFIFFSEVAYLIDNNYKNLTKTISSSLKLVESYSRHWTKYAAASILLGTKIVSILLGKYGTSLLTKKLEAYASELSYGAKLLLKKLKAIIEET